MSKFVLVDHSLVQLGGHHFDYAEHALAAAEAVGFRVFVAGHKSFRKPASWRPNWASYSLFPFTLYEELASNGSGPSEPDPQTETTVGGMRARFAWLANWRTRLDRRIVRKQATTFARGLHELFDQVQLELGDQVYFPTISIFDFFCLAEFLSDSRETRRARWHFQFHYGPAGDDGPALEPLRKSFSRAVERMGEHTIQLYATTAGLAQQIRSLGAPECHELPHHVNSRFTPELVRNPGAPLRVLCAGCPRHEKGYQHLSQIALDLWSDYFGAGRAQLCLQAKQSFLLPNRPRCRADWKMGDQTPRFQPIGQSMDPVSYIRFPLSVDDYVRMIRTADIGLFLYDPASYRNRCSGVFVEMLSAGVPVIVPGNCWMADQVRAANRQCREKGIGDSERPGMVGLVAENPNDTPALIREVLDHHRHYRAQAITHSASWRQDHVASATIARLTRTTSSQVLVPAA